jgi:hypothetical protein
MLRCEAGGAALGKKLDTVPITGDQRLLLGSTPSFDLPLGGDGIRYTIEMLGPTRVTGRRLKVWPLRAPV